MNINGGYYIKARQIKDSWVSQASPCVRETWDYLLREANHKDAKYGGCEVKRGQLFRSFREIRDDLKWRVGYRFDRYSEDEMKHCMKLLRREGMITLTSTPRGNLITVLKYSLYQDPKNYESTNESTNEYTDGTPMIHQPHIPINKNDKNKKNEKIEVTESPTQRDKPNGISFDDFCTAIENKNETYTFMVGRCKEMYKFDKFIIERELQKFYDYWTEQGEGEKKNRQQKEKSFELPKRIARWFGKVELTPRDLIDIEKAKSQRILEYNKKIFDDQNNNA